MTARVPLRDDCLVEHLPDFLAADEARALEVELLESLLWEQRSIVLFGKAVLQPRRIAWAGGLPYRYSGQTLEPRAMTPVLTSLCARVSSRVDVPFNHVLLNHYRDGTDSMGLHADDEPELGPSPCVATLSLGVARRFVLRPKGARRGPRVALTLEPGSLLWMAGETQRNYVHGIPRQARVAGSRISLTFRRLLRAPVT